MLNYFHRYLFQQCWQKLGTNWAFILRTKWFDWFKQQAVDPLRPCLPKIADFLTFQFDNNFSIDTIIGLRTAIGTTTIRAVRLNALDPTADIHLVKLIRKERPKASRLVPTGNTALVL